VRRGAGPRRRRFPGESRPVPVASARVPPKRLRQRQRQRPVEPAADQTFVPPEDRGRARERPEVLPAPLPVAQLSQPGVQPAEGSRQSGAARWRQWVAGPAWPEARRPVSEAGQQEAVSRQKEAPQEGAPSRERRERRLRRSVVASPSQGARRQPVGAQ
jgi:hypothetical protein